ncbi:MAG: 6-carboxytetrahydropterin synthase [Mesosutterella sp.]|uniref:6-carboxy-5,6,7,8-tetrahydropterin synthase n=1 Tax=Mesosutterella faecium TaxID=2925194 RepID=A0ABT7IRI4_9BURK|nr:6-carboxytetrahydropterin synthase [Mesosutterella sp. AGMB02718]MCI6529589.1 6-carboxytetrahydropterin synthase [Mesosutterella sp.]MDL2060513.1 6-carboxytetrahydropterin synthase [Mesosutterella sp. AGMB02718]
MITCTRYHDISCGHRVYGHEGKCAHLHGHNYRITFTCAGDRDDVGRVIDFSVIKARLCEWLEENYDHRFLIWEKDPIAEDLRRLDPAVVFVPFNPTAENIAEHLVRVVAPKQLEGTGVTLVRCEVEETRKCSAAFSL